MEKDFRREFGVLRKIKVSRPCIEISWIKWFFGGYTNFFHNLPPLSWKLAKCWMVHKENTSISFLNFLSWDIINFFVLRVCGGKYTWWRKGMPKYFLNVGKLMEKIPLRKTHYLKTTFLHLPISKILRSIESPMRRKMNSEGKIGNSLTQNQLYVWDNFGNRGGLYSCGWKYSPCVRGINHFFRTFDIFFVWETIGNEIWRENDQHSSVFYTCHAFPGSKDAWWWFTNTKPLYTP